MSHIVPLAQALDQSSQTQRLVDAMLSSDSPAVKALWEQLQTVNVDVEEAASIAGDDVVVVAETKTALALTQGLAIGLTLRELIEAARTSFVAGGTRQDAFRAVCELLSRSENTVIAALATELRDEV